MPGYQDPEVVQQREARFVASYVTHLNGAQAVLDAGYTNKNPRRQATALLKRPRVREAIRAKQLAQVQAYDMNANAVKRELVAIAMVDPARCFDAQGRPLPIHEIPADVRAAVKSVRVEVLPSGAMRSAIDFWNKVDALKLCAQHLALLAPKEVTVTVRFPHAHLTDEELRQKLLDSANTIEATPCASPSPAP